MTWLSDVAGNGGLQWEKVGEGLPLVLLNGMSQSMASWMTQVRHLREQYTVVSYDARGQGRSSEIGGTPSIDVHVADLLRVLDAAGLERAVLVGFSHGARVAVRAAATHPSRVQGLVATSTGSNNDAMRRTIVRSWAEVLRRGGVEGMAWCALTDILGAGYLAANEAHVEAMVRATVQRNRAESLGALLRGLQSYPDPLEEGPRVMCPSVLIVSASDLLVSLASARELAGSIAGCELVEVVDSGHTIPIEQPDAWRRAVTEFVERRVRGAQD